MFKSQINFNFAKKICVSKRTAFATLISLGLGVTPTLYANSTPAIAVNSNDLLIITDADNTVTTRRKTGAVYGKPKPPITNPPTTTTPPPTQPATPTPPVQPATPTSPAQPATPPTQSVPPPSTTTPSLARTMTLTVKVKGSGFGSVKSSPIGINCTSADVECKHTYDTATTVKLSAIAENGSEFQGWGGARDCVDNELFMVSNKLCTAYFKAATSDAVTEVKKELCPNTTRLFVKYNATGQNTGCTWTDAAISLQSIIKQVSDGNFPKVKEIWIAKGTYYPATDGNRNASFQLLNGVSIYGGFAGFETKLKERNSSANPTILSGDIGVKENNSDNSYHVVSGSNTDATALLKGVIIEGGNADKGYICPYACGGGIYINNGSPSLKHIFFQNNSAIYGGGMYNGNNSKPLVKESMFNNNSAKNGGAILNDNSSPVVTHVFLTGNTASNQGGGMVNRNQAVPLISHVNFGGNSAKLGGGIVNDNSSPVLSHSIVSDNEAVNGGGIVNLNQSSPLISHVIIGSNAAKETGSAIFNQSSSPLISQTTISGNIAGSVIVNENSQTTINNSILWANYHSSNVVPQIVDNSGSATTVNYSIVQGGWSGNGSHNKADDPQFAKPIADEITTHTTMGDFHLKVGSPAIDSGNNDLIPQDRADAECATEPFGDGDSTEIVDFDFDGRTRIIGNSVDMGAYEVQTLPEKQTLEIPKYTLTVTTTGEGKGIILSNKAGINCGDDCSQDYLSGTQINLITRTEPGSVFGGWSGNCSGTKGHFMVVMDAPKQCQAKFDVAPIEEMPKPSIDFKFDVAPVAEIPKPSIDFSLSHGSSSDNKQPCPHDRKLNTICNAGGRTITYLEVLQYGHLSNSRLDGRLISDGWVSNLLLTWRGSVSGGIVTGHIVNEGLMEDFEFVGNSITGRNTEGEIVGWLYGTIVNNSQIGGYFCDVILGPNALISNGIVACEIRGVKDASATLRNLRVEDNTVLDNLLIGANVELGENITFGTGVRFEVNTLRRQAVVYNRQSTERRKTTTVFNTKLRPLTKRGPKYYVIAGEKVDILSTITFDQTHVGRKNGELFITQLTDKGYEMRVKNRWIAWDGNIDSLQANQSLARLPATLEVPISVIPAVGKYTLYIGYRFSNNGNIIYNGGEPIQLTVISTKP